MMRAKRSAKNKGTIWIVLFVLLSFMSGIAFSAENKNFNSGYSLKLTFGWGNVPNGDINKALESFNNNDLFEWTRIYMPGLITGEIKTLNNSCPDWEIELRKHISPDVALSLATSFVPIFIKNESSLVYTYRGSVGDQTSAFTFKPRVAWIPLKLSLCFSLIRFSRIQLILSAGIGYYMTKISQSKRLDETYPSGDSQWVIWNWKAHAVSGVGYHGGLSLEYNLTEKLALVIEAQRRYARWEKLKGKSWKESEYFGNQGEEKGTLYYFNKWDIGIGTRYDELTVWKDTDFYSLEYITNIRNAILDLSGYSLRFGIRIKLF